MLWDFPVSRGAVVALALTLFSAGSGSAQVEGEPPVVARTAADGVFTNEQASRGGRLADVQCSLCHSKDEWLSPVFLDKWTGIPVSSFFDYITSTMPPNTAGQLTPSEYVDIIAYILQITGAPPGEAELPSDLAGLETILMSRSLAH